MTEVADKLFEQFVANVTELRSQYEFLYKHRRSAYTLQSDLREDNFEDRVRSHASHLKELEALVQRQNAMRCVYLNAVSVCKSYRSLFRQACERYKRLLADVAARSSEFSREQVSQIAALAMSTSKFLDKLPTFKDFDSDHGGRFDDVVHDVYKRVTRANNFEGFDSLRHSDLQELRLCVDSGYGYGQKERAALADAVNKMLDHFISVGTSRDGRDTEEWSLLRYGPWAMHPLMAMWPRTLERDIERHAYDDPHAKRNGDRLAKALLARDTALVERYDLEEALEHARHQVEGENLQTQVSKVRENMRAVEVALGKLREENDRSPSTNASLAYVMGAVALRRVAKILEKAKLPRGPQMVISGSHAQKLADPCRYVIGLLAASEQKRNV